MWNVCGVEGNNDGPLISSGAALDSEFDTVGPLAGLER
jgi:hypothetical protein